VHCGVASASLRPCDEPAATPFRLACVARLEAKKGHAELLDAIAELVRCGVDVRCDLVGDGPQRRALAQRIDALGLGDRVTLHGAQPRERALACVRDAHAVALPSLVTATGRRDGIPVALMEAMALGRPVVATELSGIPELVVPERTGLLVPPGDRDALVTALARLASDPALRHQLGRAARAHVAALFDVDRSSDRLRELFAAAIGASAPPYVAIEPVAASEVSG
jgi:glycosyltransferase involved in cell wall biosynthesis